MNALNVMQRLGSGTLIEEIHLALLSVSSEVVASGKPGSVTITLKVSHPRGSDPLLVVVDEDVKRTLPKTDAKGAMFFAVESALHERDPRQAELPSFRLVEQPEGAELRNPEEAGQTMREAE